MRKADNNTKQINTTLGFLIRLFILSVGVNYVWEMVQMPLYNGMSFSDSKSWLLCFRASLGDGIIILVIWGSGRLVFRSWNWFLNPGISTASVLIIAGTVIAVGIEIHALANGRWSYSSIMPIVPPLGIGLSPLLQLIILPIVLMIAADKLSKRS